MGTPIAPLKVEIGDTVKGVYQVKKKLGEGACGSVYLVQSLKDPKLRAAMKVEPRMKNKDDEILKMEVYVLKKLQLSKHVCRLLFSGKTDNYNFMVITLLGKELSELRRRQPDRKLSTESGLKIGIQVVQVSFRGTVRYCSLNVHQYKEQGRHDDLWSMLFMLIELITANLPWKGLNRKESGLKKDSGCPPSFHELNTLLKKLTYHDLPPYDQIRKSFLDDLTKLKAKLTDPFEWEKKTDVDISGKKKITSKEVDVQAEKDPTQRTEDTDTNRDPDKEDSVESAASSGFSDASGFAREDTLDSVADMRNVEKKG